MRIRVWQVKNIFSDSLKVADWGGSVFCVMPYEPMILHTLWGVNVETAIKACRALGYIGISAKPRLKMWHGKWYCQEITVKSKKMEAPKWQSLNQTINSLAATSLMSCGLRYRA